MEDYRVDKYWKNILSGVLFAGFAIMTSAAYANADELESLQNKEVAVAQVEKSGSKSGVHTPTTDMVLQKASVKKEALTSHSVDTAVTENTPVKKDTAKINSVVNDEKIAKKANEKNSSEVVKHGLVTDGGRTFYYDKNGNMHFGYLKYKDSYMYFDEHDGHAIKGERFYGKNKMEYYNNDFSQVRGAYVATGDTYYYIGKYGDAVKGARHYGNHKMEYYDNDFKQVRDAYVDAGNTYYYIGKYGDAVRGKRYYGNHKMEYYDNDFKQVRGAYVKAGNTYYYISKYGDAVKGERHYGNHKMEYYDNDFKQVRGDYVETGNTFYYISKYGDAVKGERHYGNHKMEYYNNNFKQVRGDYVKTGNTYYYIGKHGDAVTGFRVYGNRPYQVEYYNKNNFKQVRNSSVTESGVRYRFAGNGNLIVAKNPKYFSQLDGRWSRHNLHGYTMGQAGCVPTSIAMVLKGSYGHNVNPENLRSVMNHKKANYFGSTGQDLIDAVNRYGGRKVKVIKTVSETSKLLQRGIPIIEFVRVGNITHAIVLHGFNNGATQVYDPYNRAFFNGKYNVSYLASRISNDRGDWNAGRPVFAIM